MTRRLLFTTYVMLLWFGGNAQTETQKAKIVANYNMSVLDSITAHFKKQAENNKQLIREYLKEQSFKQVKSAKFKGEKVKSKDGSYSELVGIDKKGDPIYYNSFTNDLPTRTRHLHNGGGLGLDLEGQNMELHIWDTGPVRTTHKEFGSVIGSRVLISDGQHELGSGSAHATHVTGIAIGLGLDSLTRGNAPKAIAKTYDWHGDFAEAAQAASRGMLISNHSYGRQIDIDAGDYGAYLPKSRNWDLLMYNAPYYLMVQAAGNDGENDVNDNPQSGYAGYDKLVDKRTTKNNLVVANLLVQLRTDGSVFGSTASRTTSFGPTDDYRIKPDLGARGVAWSSTSTSDYDYEMRGGTSMASPAIAASLLLLQQYYDQQYGGFMKAATLKGVALTTAEDIEDLGPDTKTGWGLMNTKKAAEIIRDKDQYAMIEELRLNPGETYRVTIESTVGADELRAAISWTDPPGQLSNGINDATPVLVNDLDIKVIDPSGNTQYPWKLFTAIHNGKGVNDKDPFERVDITNPQGRYIIEVTHKGTLQDGHQDFSLIVTGIGKTCTVISTATNDFEDYSSTGTLEQDYHDDIDWTWNSNGTSSDFTGPSSGANGSHGYLYLEGSVPNIGGKTATLYSPCYQVDGGLYIGWQYHMYGQDMGTLKLEMRHNQNDWMEVWQTSGNQGDQWHSEEFDLSMLTGNVQFRWTGITGDGGTSDMALDNFIVSDQPTCIDIPDSLRSTEIGSNHIDLAWNRLTLYPEYDLEVNGEIVAANVEASTYQLTGLTPNTEYSIRIKTSCSSIFSDPIVVRTEDTCLDLSETRRQSFESGDLELFRNIDGDDFDWSLNTGQTDTPNTGPDAAEHGRYYMYVEASNYSASQKAVLRSRCIDLSNVVDGELWFKYHMTGSGVGSLNVKADGQTVWSRSGDITDGEWVHAWIKLNGSYTDDGKVVLEFEATGGTNVYGDIAIDNVVLIDRGLGCMDLSETRRQSFEDSNLEIFANVGGDDFDWRRHTGSTSTWFTGPNGAEHGSYYMYIEASDYYQNQKAILRSGCIYIRQATDPELWFKYHMRGSGTGTLTVKADGQTVWSRSGNSPTAGWIHAWVNLNGSYADDGKVVLEFEADGGNNQMGDIAIDNIVLIDRGLDALSSTPLTAHENPTETVESELKVDASIDIYPNPVRDILNVSSKENIKSYAIIDLGGKIQKSGEVNQSHFQLSLSSLPKGLYIIILTNDLWDVDRIKFLKQ